MRVENLPDWPPFPSAVLGTSGQEQAVFRGCDFVTRSSRHAAHLLVRVRLKDRNYTAVYWHPSESILLRLMASLHHLSGLALSKVGEVELLELRPMLG